MLVSFIPTPNCLSLLLKRAGGVEQVRGRISQGIGGSGAGHSHLHPLPCSFEGPGAGACDMSLLVTCVCLGLAVLSAVCGELYLFSFISSGIE